MATPTITITEKDWLRPEEAAAVVGLSRAMIYILLSRGELASVKVGRARRISRAALRAWAERVEREQNPA